MKLTFLGAAHEVTGSCTLLENAGTKILIDCGMEQGSNTFENMPCPYAPGEIDYVLVTHAHVDHSGMLPLLYKNGFRGTVFATRETCNLSDIMLKDCAHIQISDAQYQTKKAKRAGKPAVEPLYDMEDAEGILRLFRPCPYGKKQLLNENICIRFTDAGHLLGSASIEIWLKENGVEKKLVCSGDIGNTDQPIINDPKPVREADYLLVESTYGNRSHEAGHSYQQTIEALAGYIQKTLDRKGNVIIPSFSVGRTQEILYFIREIKNSGMIKNHPGFPVYVDSPLSNEATSVFLQCDMSCLDDHAKAVMANGDNPLVFDGLHTFVTTEESKALNTDPTPKVILASSGMCDAGRIRHHLKYNLWRKESLILFVGYQSDGTLGRSIYDGAKKVTLFGEEIAVKAQIALLPGISGHADREGLLNWVEGFAEKPTRVFVNHGDDDACMAFAQQLTARGYSAMAPYSGTEFDLSADAFVTVTKGVPVGKKKAGRKTAFDRLLATVERLRQVAQTCKGRPNKEIARFCSELESLCDRYK